MSALVKRKSSAISEPAAAAAAESTPTVYYGEQLCTSAGCKTYAKYAIKDVPLCGTHARKTVDRLTLPENPNKEEFQRQLSYERAKEAYEHTDQHLTCVRYWRFGDVPFEPGYFTVLPNSNAGYNVETSPIESHIQRANKLSPMLLGPVKHRQPGLPDAANLENFWQSNKVFQHECSNWGADKPLAELEILPVFFAKQRELYADTKAHRHKYGLARKNQVAFARFIAKDGCELRMPYVESRMIYCSFYEDLARYTYAFHIIKNLRKRRGCNLLIAGPDGRNAAPHDVSRAIIEAWYNDASKPFGHESVLLAMLIIEDGKGEPDLEWLPWRRAWRAMFGVSFKEYMK